MKRKLVILLLILSASGGVSGQDHDDWPSSLPYFTIGNDKVSKQICDGKEVKHREAVSGTLGKEFYCRGNLHAEGPLRKLSSHTVIHADKNNKAVLTTRYVREGHWKVYFDSASRILRSEGKFADGVRDGKWILYHISGATRYEIEFLQGQLRTKVGSDEDGNRTLTVERSEVVVNIKLI